MSGTHENGSEIYERSPRKQYKWTLVLSNHSGCAWAHVENQTVPIYVYPKYNTLYAHDIKMPQPEHLMLFRPLQEKANHIWKHVALHPEEMSRLGCRFTKSDNNCMYWAFSDVWNSNFGGGGTPTNEATMRLWAANAIQTERDLQRFLNMERLDRGVRSRTEGRDTDWDPDDIKSIQQMRSIIQKPQRWGDVLTIGLLVRSKQFREYGIGVMILDQQGYVAGNSASTTFIYPDDAELQPNFIVVLYHEGTHWESIYLESPMNVFDERGRRFPPITLFKRDFLPRIISSLLYETVPNAKINDVWNRQWPLPSNRYVLPGEGRRYERKINKITWQPNDNDYKGRSASSYEHTIRNKIDWGEPVQGPSVRTEAKEEDLFPLDYNPKTDNNPYFIGFQPGSPFYEAPPAPPLPPPPPPPPPPFVVRSSIPFHGNGGIPPAVPFYGWMR